MNINIKYPTHLQEIPLSAYQKWLKVEETTNDEEILAFKFVSIFCGLEMKTVSRMSVKDVHFIINKIKEVLNQKPEFHQRWKYNGVEFGLIPDLENISFGEYIDIESHITKWDGLHKAFAVLFRPISNTLKDTYTIAEYEPNDKYIEIMQNLPLNIVLSTSVFFLNLESELLNNLTLYLKKQTRKTKKTNIVNGRSLANRGIGTIAFTDLAAEISKELTALPIVPYLKPLPTFHTLRKKTKSKPTSAKDKLEKQKIKV